MKIRYTLSGALLVGFVTLCLSASATPAQDPIRVESHQVLVPAVVFDSRQYAQLQKKAASGEALGQESQIWETVIIRDLAVKDFHLLEDGQEQRVESVKLQPPDFSVVRDSLGRHPESIGTGGGRWAYPDRPATDSTVWFAWPQYVIAYVPPGSPEGSCHQIQVKVGRADAIVWARSEYCNTRHPASDPLNGTEFGKQMEEDLAPGKESKIDLALQAVPFYEQAGTARVSIELEFPWQSLKHEIKNGTLYANIGALGMVYNKDGTVAARFSDFACCDYGTGSKTPSKSKTSSSRLNEDTSMIPNRYETQVELPPGEYDLRMVLSDGEKFGRAQVPLTVASYDGKQLAISGVALSKRIQKVEIELPGALEKLPESYLPLVSRDIAFSLTANNRFKSDEPLYAYFEVYDPQLGESPTSTTEAHLRVVDAKTGNVRMESQTVSVAHYINAGSPVIPIGRKFILSGLSAGSYRLEVQASDATGKSTAWSAANFVLESAIAPKTAADILPHIKKDVILNVTALGSSGEPVADLTSADFQIFDNGKAQPIISFRANGTQPAGNPPSTLILFDLLNSDRSQREFLSSQIVQVLENLETSGSVYLYLLTERGEIFAVHALPTPQQERQPAQVGGVAENEEVAGAQWTRQIHPLLAQAIQNGSRPSPANEMDPGIRATVSLKRVGELGEQFTKVPGSKTMAWITRGVPNWVNYLYGCQDVAFTEGSRGYIAGKCGAGCAKTGEQCVDYAPFLQHFTAELVKNDVIFSSVDVAAKGGHRAAAPGTAGDTLEQLAELTGGQLYLASEVERAITEPLKNARGRYQLAFDEPSPDGKYHKLRVVCTREGVRVDTQESYFAGLP